ARARGRSSHGEGGSDGGGAAAVEFSATMSVRLMIELFGCVLLLLSFLQFGFAQTGLIPFARATADEARAQGTHKLTFKESPVFNRNALWLKGTHTHAHTSRALPRAVSVAVFAERCPVLLMCLC